MENCEKYYWVKDKYYGYVPGKLKKKSEHIYKFVNFNKKFKGYL
jgi:hypothetical protein